MGNWLDTDCYDDAKLTVWLIESAEGEVQGIYGDEDWACKNSHWNTDGSGEVAVVRQVTFRRGAAKEMYHTEIEDEEEEDEDDEGDADGEADED